jgi:CRP-like cAMP-binding protein
VQRALILKTFPGFVALNASELAVLASICRERFFPAGATMHEPGVPVVAFHLVVDGRVHILRRGRVIQEFGARSSVGGLAALTRDPQGAHAIAVEDTLALEIDTDDMHDVFEDNYSIALGVLGALARTLRELQMQLGGAAMAARRTFEPVASDRPLHTVDKMFFLRRTTNFATASIEALAHLAASTIEHRFEAGTVLWEQGDPADYSLLIMNGTIVGLPQDEEPLEFPVGFIVGGLDSLGREPRWYRAVAKGNLLALELRRDYMLDALEDHPDMVLDLMRGLATGVNAMFERIAARKADTSHKGKARQGAMA